MLALVPKDPSLSDIWILLGLTVRRKELPQIPGTNETGLAFSYHFSFSLGTEGTNLPFPTYTGLFQYCVCLFPLAVCIGCWWPWVLGPSPLDHLSSLASSVHNFRPLFGFKVILEFSSATLKWPKWTMVQKQFQLHYCNYFQYNLNCTVWNWVAPHP